MQPELRQDPGNARQAQAKAAGEASNAATRPNRTWPEWARSIGISIAAGVTLSLLGALGTDNLPLTQRLLYWMPLILGGAVIGNVVTGLVLLIPRAGANLWIFFALLSFAVSIPVTLMVWLYTSWMIGTNFSLDSLPYLYGSVLTISAAMTGIMILASQPGTITHAPPAGAAPATVRFMERLPPKLKGAVIYAISAEDHYLKLHTSKGVDLILMRLTDAVAELEGLEGAQTHRSWWVARDAVEGARREGDRMVLTIKGGVEAPVSRPNVRPLREAGWY